MNKFKSLSDSSTSESEDDYSKRKTQSSYSISDSWSSVKRSHSTDDTEEEQQAEVFYRMAQQPSNFKKPNKYSERRISTDDTEDEHSETMEPPSKKFKGDFKNPAQYIEREISTDQTDSESDDKTSSVKMTPNMPSLDVLNGSYGVGMKLMEKMGYKSGTGLGKYEQGRVNIVEASKQRGRRGLGHVIPGLEPSDATWTASQDEMISLNEDVEWIPSSKLEPLKITELRDWMLEGEEKKVIVDETEFCEPDILNRILLYKSVFDNLEPEEMRKARTRSNPFETIRGGIFLNRAAMKMANMDAVFDFMFTNPKKINGEPAIDENELLYFADVCAGPGGFSEYVLWRKRWECKGFGFTLKGKNDFKLEDFFAGPPETFEPYYGPKDDGDIYNPENLKAFRKFVHSDTDEKGVHFVMADGGFSVEGMENEQEILSKRLYLCQFHCALSILRTGGHFVCKLFDIFTPFSVGLIYLMYMAFEKVCIFKPNTSRPANSERYIICKWLKENTKDICDYMFEVNECLDKHCKSGMTQDVREVVPLHVLKENKIFFDYIFNSNNKLGLRQSIHLDKIKAFAQNPDLHEEKQSELRKECLKLWKVPDEIRSAPPKVEPDAKYKTIMTGERLNYISSSPTPLSEALFKKLKYIYDYHCVICGETHPDTPPSLFLGLGKFNLYRYDIRNTKWIKIDLRLELPADTLFYGELLSELRGEGKAQRRIISLHIVDVICLGGKNVKNLHFGVRMQLAKKLAKAVSKPSRSDYAPLRVKNVWCLKDIEEIFDRLSMKFPKSNNSIPRLGFDLDEGRHIIPSGVLIFKTTADPWVTAYSKTNKREYFFNTKKNISHFERVPEACADFRTCFSDRILWNWGREVKLTVEQNMEAKSSLIHGHTMREFVKNELISMTGKPF